MKRIPFIIISLFLHASVSLAHDVPEDTRRVPFNANVLHIGDSQVSGPYARCLGSLIQRSPYVTYRSHGRPGWGVRAWIDNYHIVDQLLRDTRASLVIITIGGNDWYRYQHVTYTQDVQLLWSMLTEDMQRAHGRVIWVGPPRAVGRSSGRAYQREQISRRIEATIGHQNFIDTTNFEDGGGRTADGIHFNLRGACIWARQVYSAIMDRI